MPLLECHGSFDEFTFITNTLFKHRCMGNHIHYNMICTCAIRHACAWMHYAGLPSCVDYSSSAAPAARQVWLVLYVCVFLQPMHMTPGHNCITGPARAGYCVYRSPEKEERTRRVVARGSTGCGKWAWASCAGPAGQRMTCSHFSYSKPHFSRIVCRPRRATHDVQSFLLFQASLFTHRVQAPSGNA